MAKSNLERIDDELCAKLMRRKTSCISNDLKKIIENEQLTMELKIARRIIHKLISGNQSVGLIPYCEVADEDDMDDIDEEVDDILSRLSDHIQSAFELSVEIEDLYNSHKEK